MSTEEQTIYHVVTTAHDTGEKQEYLIEADSAAIAKSHVRRLVSAEKAPQQVLVRLLSAGVKVEKAVVE